MRFFLLLTVLTVGLLAGGFGGTAIAEPSCDGWRPVPACPPGSVRVRFEQYSGNPFCHTDGYPDVQLNSITIEPPPNLPVWYMLLRVAGGWQVGATGATIDPAPPPHE